MKENSGGGGGEQKRSVRDSNANKRARAERAETQERGLQGPFTPHYVSRPPCVPGVALAAGKSCFFAFVLFVFQNCIEKAAGLNTMD